MDYQGVQRHDEDLASNYKRGQINPYVLGYIINGLGLVAALSVKFLYVVPRWRYLIPWFFLVLLYQILIGLAYIARHPSFIWKRRSFANPYYGLIFASIAGTGLCYTLLQPLSGVEPIVLSWGADAVGMVLSRRDLIDSFVLFFFVGFSMIFTVNCAFDFKPAVERKAVVREQYTSIDHNGAESYHWKIAIDGASDVVKVRVLKAAYEENVVGSEVALWTKQGALGISWINDLAVQR